MTNQPIPADQPSYASRIEGSMWGLSLADTAWGTTQRAAEDSLALTGTGQQFFYVADGLLETIEWANQGTGADPSAAVWLALLRWYKAVRGEFPLEAPQPLDRWIDQAAAVFTTDLIDEATLGALNTGDMPVLRTPAENPEPSLDAVVRASAFGMVPGVDEEFVASLAEQSTVLTTRDLLTQKSAVLVAVAMHQIFAGADMPTALEHAVELVAGTPESEPLAGLPGQVADEGLARTVGAAGAAVLSIREGTAAEDWQRVRQELLDSETPEAVVLAAVFVGARYGIETVKDDSAQTQLADHDLVAETIKRWIAETT